MTNEYFSTANAYLDGDLSDAERLRVESVPAVMTEVERLRAMREALGRSTPDPVQRERSIAAALVEYSRLHDSGPAVIEFDPTPIAGQPVSTSTAQSGSWRVGRWLSAAAVVVAIAVLGVIIKQSSGGGDDAADSSSKDRAAAMNAEESPAAAETETVNTTTALAEATVDSGEAMTDSTPTTAAAGNQSESTTNLATIGRQLYTADQAGTLGITPETRCQVEAPNSNELVYVLGQREIQLDGQTVLALIGYADTTPLTYVAISPDDCTILLTAT